VVKRKGGYVPERGDAVWVTLDARAGHEQAGRRPALVLSPAAYNGRVGLALLCPITGQVKGYPFEVALPEGLAVSGVALADQVKSLDWRARKAARICAVPAEVVAEVMRRLHALLEGEA
jgi:mRNA interferase MazF